MCKQNLSKEALALGQTANYNDCFWVEDVNGQAIGYLEFDFLLHSMDLVEVDFGISTRCYVVYSEDKDISNEFLLFEEISAEEFMRFRKEWEGSDIHFVVGDEVYGSDLDEGC